MTAAPAAACDLKRRRWRCPRHRQAAAEGTNLPELSELNDPSTLYVSDSLPPVAYTGAFRLLITSPKKENWSSFTESPSVELFVLPMFSEDEKSWNFELLRLTPHRGAH